MRARHPGTERPRASSLRFGAAQQGFTLVELMVVIVIIGLMSGAVVLTMADPRGRISGDIDRFAGRVRAARDDAVISGRAVALWVSPTAYGFEQRARGQWQPVREGPLASQDWSGGASADLGSAGQARIVFDSVGRADQPLRFVLRRDDQQVTLRMDLDGNVSSGD
ncbi:GspH/FimT family pseudopilin [Sphingobium lignivorans]|uniref:Type II secretion system protein H n=1 Tax=Sphingobium lignivorans TaxID=2735886 RepID=A0ABR6NDR2_9SPHN|nr:GspH/FimT family pseudopilin [Sphingobium lignivorans]MBB5985410.1 general secretion pathway protein H [Sphingobium lignivorans]